MQKIGRAAFRECGRLAAVAFAEDARLREIGDGAFAESALGGPADAPRELRLPASLQTIGEAAFSGCANLRAVAFAAGAELREIEARAFCGAGLAELQVPASVQVIGESAFEDCRSLERLSFGEGSQLREIKNKAFYGCKKLRRVAVPRAARYAKKPFPLLTAVSRK